MVGLIACLVFAFEAVWRMTHEREREALASAGFALLSFAAFVAIVMVATP